ncbi:DMT family transporter [Vibrio echinoideorum]|uniref:DMT family transporter n=1 Tax=Vibrio echinoideorum TaxID=2100116 RepID=UPI001FDA1F28|nr:DMT family transporter [Vibrio echinoideorum]
MAVGARELSGNISTYQVLLVRSVIGLCVVSFLIFASKQKELFSTNRLPLHSLRNVFHFGGQFGWFVGIGLLPLSEVFALEFTVPLWTALLASLFLGESLTLKKMTAIALGLLGVVIIVQPTQDVISVGAIIVLCAAFCYSVAHTSTKSLASTEAPLTILFYMCLIQLPIDLVLSWQTCKTPSALESVWLLVVALSALSAHYCLTKAMKNAEVTLVMILDFFRLPAIAVVGILLYDEPLTPALIIGGVVMLFGNLLVTYKSNRRNQ